MTTSALLIALAIIPSLALAKDEGRFVRDYTHTRATSRHHRTDSWRYYSNMHRLGRYIYTRRYNPRRFTFSERATVTGIIDGSVLRVETERGKTENVRTLGAEAPLMITGSNKAQCFAAKSQYELEKLLLRKVIHLERDRKFQRDNRGRLLRYVKLDGLDVNGWMLWNGYAQADRNNQYSKQMDYLSREDDARENHRGMWGDVCDYNPTPSKTIRILQ